MKWTKPETDRLIELVRKVGLNQAIVVLNGEFGNDRSKISCQSHLERWNISYTSADPHHRVVNEPPSLKMVDQDARVKNLLDQVSHLRAKYDIAIDNVNVQGKLIELGERFITSLPAVLPVKPPVLKSGHSTESLVLLLSDLHAGEVVRSEEMNGINEYNFDICNRRLKFMSNTIIDLALNKLKGYQFDSLKIFGLGDFLSGNIHDELIEDVDGNILKWTVDLSYVLAQMIRQLSASFKEVEFVGVVGNHGRMHQKPRFKARYVNWDFLCYQYMSMFLSDQKNVKFKIPTSFWTTHEVKDHTWLLMHGDNINTWAGIPWYGINRTVTQLKELLEAKNQRFEYIALGHFHNRGILDRVRGELMINGSVIGGNEYSIGKMFTTNEACQSLFGVHKDGVTFNYKIRLQNLNGAKIEPFKYLNIADETLGESLRNFQDKENK